MTYCFIMPDYLKKNETAIVQTKEKRNEKIKKIIKSGRKTL